MNTDDVLDVYVPGCWICPKCNFALSKQTIFVQSGTVGVSHDDVMRMDGEICPNDGEPMRRETWHERAESNHAWGRKLMEDIIVATGAEHLPGALEAIKERFQSSAVSPREEPKTWWNEFHHLWTKAVRSPDYVKAEWVKLEGLLLQASVPLSPEPSNEDRNLSTLLELNGPEPTPIKVAAFLRHYAGIIRKNERWDIPETMAKAYESAASALERYVPGLSPAPAPLKELEPGDYAVIAEGVNEFLGYDIVTREQQDRITAWAVRMSALSPQPPTQTPTCMNCGADIHHVHQCFPRLKGFSERLPKAVSGSPHPPSEERK